LCFASNLAAGFGTGGRTLRKKNVGRDGTNESCTAFMVYFYARATHIVVYTFGVPMLKTVAVSMGFGAQTELVRSQ